MPLFGLCPECDMPNNRMNCYIKRTSGIVCFSSQRLQEKKLTLLLKAANFGQQPFAFKGT